MQLTSRGSRSTPSTIYSKYVIMSKVMGSLLRTLFELVHELPVHIAYS